MYQSRTRRIAKWTGLTTLGLLFAVLVANQQWGIDCIINDTYISMETGGLWMGSLPVGEYDGFFDVHRVNPGIVWWIRRYELGALNQPGWFLILPLWPLVVAIAIPTAWFWRRDRRHPPGHCKRCGYDLTGNVTGVCSECGEAN